MTKTLTHLAARQLKRWNPFPSLRNRTTGVVPDREPQGGHPLHVCWTASAVGSGIGILGDFVRVNAIWEAQDSLHVSTAGRPRECGAGPAVAILGAVSVTPPRDSRDLLVDVLLALSSGVTCNGVEVFRERDLGVIDLLVVGLEGPGIDLGVVVSVHVIERGSP